MIRFNRPFCEHICFAFQISVFIYIFQRTQEIVRRIIGKCLSVGTIVNQTILFNKIIISSIQFCLLLRNHFIRKILQLILDQFINNSPKCHHSFHTFFRFVIQLHMAHNRVFTKINFSVCNSIGKILYIRHCRNGFCRFS